jgi:hypothetical protein
MNRHFFFILILFSGIKLTFSQGTIFEEKRTIYASESSLGFQLHTSGFGINYRNNKYLTGFTKRSIEIEWATIKHPKEVKSYNPNFDDAKSYVLGKLNSFSTLRLSVGYHKVFIGKQSIKGIDISWLYNVGLSLGYAKPYYLLVIKRIDLNSTILQSETFKPAEHNITNIYGRDNGLRGLFEGKIYPGVHSKFGFNFETSPYSDGLKSIECGVAVDYYFKEIPIMALTKNYSLFFNLYINFLIGGKKTV